MGPGERQSAPRDAADWRLFPASHRGYHQTVIIARRRPERWQAPSLEPWFAMLWHPDFFGAPPEQFALDELMLEEAERASEPRETLRMWEATAPAVILGRSSKLASEARLDECALRGVTVYRRASGGAAVVVGPGCLMYSVVLSYALRPEIAQIDQAHQLVMARLRDAVARLTPGIEHRGTCDLVLNGRKFSGNSLRCRRTHLLYHGTLLYAFPLELLDALLAHPPREPDYRARRKHGQFVVNLNVPADALRAAVRAAFPTTGDAAPIAAERVARLAADKYAADDWTRQH